jgi:hypothetical protein
MTFESIGETELNACFGSTKSHYGNSLQKLFLNHMVVKSQTSMTVFELIALCL